MNLGVADAVPVLIGTHLVPSNSPGILTPSTQYKRSDVPLKLAISNSNFPPGDNVMAVSTLVDVAFVTRQLLTLRRFEMPR